MSAMYADPWELGQKEKNEGSRLYVVLTESNSVPLTLRGAQPSTGAQAPCKHGVELREEQEASLKAIGWGGWKN